MLLLSQERCSPAKENGGVQPPDSTPKSIVTIFECYRLCHTYPTQIQNVIAEVEKAFRKS